MLFPCFTIFFVFIVWLNLKLKFSKKAEFLKSERFWIEETKANETRRQDISKLPYISIPLDHFHFPTIKDEKLEELKTMLIELSTKKIVNLTGTSNTDLKLQYGVANLATLSEYDVNFTQLVRTLKNLGHRLYDLNYVDEAQVVLEFGVTCGTDIRAHYVLLATIYEESNQSEKILVLKEFAQKLNSLMKEPILNYLKESTMI